VRHSAGRLDLTEQRGAEGLYGAVDDGPELAGQRVVEGRVGRPTQVQAVTVLQVQQRH